MAYVHRRVVAGSTVEHRKMMSPRYNTKGVQRGPNRGTTSEKQAKINRRVAEEHLRWDICANFGYRDYHVCLHYAFLFKPTTLQQILEDKRVFLRELRKQCRKHGIRVKYITVIETKSMTNPHIHLVINRVDIDVIQKAWEVATAGNGYISFQCLDKRGNHAELAHYLVKEGRSTMKRYKELGIRGKQYTKSQNMAKPEVTYEPVTASSWRKDPKPANGAYLYKFKDGSTTRTGWHELTGYPFQEYFEIFAEGGGTT